MLTVYCNAIGKYKIYFNRVKIITYNWKLGSSNWWIQNYIKFGDWYVYHTVRIFFVTGVWCMRIYIYIIHRKYSRCIIASVIRFWILITEASVQSENRSYLGKMVFKQNSLRVFQFFSLNSHSTNAQNSPFTIPEMCNRLKYWEHYHIVSPQLGLNSAPAYGCTQSKEINLH
jgi:hypothetical protein